MDYTHIYNRLSTGEHCIQSCKMILNQRVFLIPRHLIIKGCRVITFGRALHRNPGKMRHPDIYTQRRLPVTLEFVPTEIKIPIGHSVKLRHYTFSSILMRRRLRLLYRIIFCMIKEHIYAGKLEGSVKPHRISVGTVLVMEGMFTI